MITEERCSGCSACKYTCPVNAIEIKIDELTGFKLAEIDTMKCINCGKCDDVCPHISEKNKNAENKQEKYALQASEEIRKVSTSGGAFTVLANYYSSLGYKIVGVQWDKDWHAEYAIAETEEECHRFRGSKYMQPDTKDIFPKIKQLLDNNEKVLFTGVPCHVSGLLNFLGKKYDNLVTVDLFCGALSSPIIWDKWYEYQDIDKENIKNINMRAKQKQGNNIYVISIEGKDGQIHNIPYKCSMAQRIIGSRKWSLPVCHECKYRDMDRVSDYTIADLWNSAKSCPELHCKTESQVSTFLCNSDEAKKVVKIFQTDENIIIKEIDSVKAPQNFVKKDTKTIFETLQKEGLKKPKKDTKEKPYDIGICGGTFNNNFGATLTYYALYRYLELQGYKTILLPPSEKVFKGGMQEGNVFDKYCNVAPNHFKTNITKFNELANTFILGSDQLWNHDNALGKMGPKMYLDYIKDDKTKIAYSVSYGGNGSTENTALNDKKHYNRIKRLIKEFDYISTREKEGINITKEIFERDDCAHVIDPVFLLENDEYDKLINDSNIELPNKYGVLYQLCPSQGLINFTKEINNKNKVTTILIGDGQLPNVKKYKQTFTDEVFVNPILAQDWLKYIKNAEYVITGSFHCCCFCTLFNIPFLCVRNEKTLSNIRIKWLLTLINQENRFMYSGAKNIKNALKILSTPPNATDKLVEFIKYSKDWLQNTLGQTPKTLNAISTPEKIKVAATIISKNEEETLVEWVEHYKLLGFDNIIFFDNNENNNQYNLLLPYIKSGFIIYNDYKNLFGLELQHDAYNETLNKFLKSYDWIFFVDADEFLILRKHKNIKSFLHSNEKFNVFDGIVFPWLFTTDSNIIYNDKRLSFCENKYNIPANGKTIKLAKHKTIINTNRGFENCTYSVHSFGVNIDNICNAAGLHPSECCCMHANNNYDYAILLHTKYKNILNTIMRINRGDCNAGRIYDTRIFEERLKNEIIRFFQNNEITQEKINTLYDAFPEYKDFIYNLLKDKYPNIQK